MLKFLQPGGMLAATALDRRRFLKVGALGGAGFVIGCAERGEEVADGERSAAPVSATDLNAFVRIGSDDTVTVIVKHLDKGQGVTTGLPTIVAEELDADWAQMRYEFAPADVKRYANLLFGAQATGGSTAIANSYMQLREAAAGARAMLVAAAADAWGVAPGEIRVEAGTLRHADGDRSASFGELAAAAAAIPVPEQLTLKNPEDFRLIGRYLPRLDSAPKSTGKATYTIDIERPGMRIAVIAHPPRFGGKVARVDASKALALPGVVAVHEVATGVAVLANSFYTAKQGRDALIIEWDDSVAEMRGSDEMLAEFNALLDQQGLVARDDGDAPGVLAGADSVIAHRFELPFLAHATMEPMDCVVELAADRCDIWTGAQLQTVDQQVVAGMTGIPMSDVHIHTQFAGGSFGRRATPASDYIAEAVSIAQAVDGAYPVKLVWTRENDMAAGYYRPLGVHELRASIGADGLPNAWHHRIVVPSILAGTPFEAMVENGIDGASVEGARNVPYPPDNVRVELHSPKTGVPVLWWRSVGHTHNAWVVETMIDQLALAAGRDPVEYRLALLGDAHPRLRGVLTRVAAEARWDEAPGDGTHRGVSVHESFSSFVAQVVEISVGEKGNLRVERVVCAVDCGVAINPDVIRAQVEGAVGMGLSAYLREAVHLDAGRVREQNFHAYQPLRIHEMPKVEVHIVDSAEAPTGIGEPGLPPLAPALTNAIFAATGKLITRLPLGDQLRSS